MLTGRRKKKKKKKIVIKMRAAQSKPKKVAQLKDEGRTQRARGHVRCSSKRAVHPGN